MLSTDIIRLVRLFPPSPRLSAEGPHPLDRLDTTRPAIYARSSKEDSSSLSIPFQVAQVSSAFPFLRGSVPVFSDRLPGTIIVRPGFLRLISYQPSVIFVYRLDRLSRDPLVLHLLRPFFSIVSSSEPHITASPVGRLLFSLTAGLALHEIEILSSRTRDSLSSKHNWPSNIRSTARFLRSKGLSYRKISDYFQSIGVRVSKSSIANWC